MPEISSLFRWCLHVWQLFSLAWCSILLEGGRWFRRFTVTLTDPNHLLPLLASFLFFFFLILIHTPSHTSHLHMRCKHTSNKPHMSSQVDISSRLSVIADYLHIGRIHCWHVAETPVICSGSVICNTIQTYYIWSPQLPGLWPWLYAFPEAPFQNKYCWLAGHLICWGHLPWMRMWTETLAVFFKVNICLWAFLFSSQT